jgi:hypothetical protein
MKGQPFHYSQQREEPAKEEEKKDGEEKGKEGAKADEKPKNGCNPGEILAADGNCYFEGELVKLRNKHN